MTDRSSEPGDAGRRNIAARAGAWSSRHRQAAILIWVGFVLFAVVAGSLVGTRHISPDTAGDGESGAAMRTLHDRFPQAAEEQVLIHNSTLTVRSARFRATVSDVVRDLSSLATVQSVLSPYVAANRGEISADGHSVLISFQITGRAADAVKRVGASVQETVAAQKAHPGFVIRQAGDASVTKALEESFAEDLARARFLSLPLTLVILILAFGALVAAAVPVVLAITAVAAALGIVALVSHLSPVDEIVSETVLLIGMAVGVDYSLFYMRRVREERAAGADTHAALRVAAATSGRSVFISGLTVMTAMAGMYLTADRTFASIATGTILVVAVAVVGSLTVLPALLSLLGDRVMSARVPFIARRRDREDGGSRMWSTVIDAVMRRPVHALLVSGGLLVALAIPALGLRTSVPGVRNVPASLPIVRTINSIEQAFPGGPQPAYLVVQAPSIAAPSVKAGLTQLEQRALATGQIHEPFQTEVNPAGNVAVVLMRFSGAGTDAVSERALATLRREVIPGTLGRLPGVRTQVAGPTALSVDFNGAMRAHAPLVFAFVLTLALVLLLLTFRSLVMAVTAIALNLLSVAAAYGVLVLIFQGRWAERLLDFKSSGSITSWLPLFLFVVLFGLSMDYHVFITSRIREGHDRGMATRAAIEHGIKSTAGVVTSAAAVMVAVFSIFATLSQLEFKQTGIGLAVAILLDATVVRGVLLPATMRLLGESNWYLPLPLRGLTRSMSARSLRAGEEA